MRLYVPLQPEEVVKLHNLALRERRTPQQQAALILGDALAVETPRRITPDTAASGRGGADGRQD